VRRHPRGTRVALGLSVLAAAASVLLWLWLSRFESTDDAQIDGHIATLSSRITGTVTAVHVQENDPVRAGQPLVELDPRDYQIALARAQAALAQARAQLEAQTPNVPIVTTSARTQAGATLDDVQAARAVLDQARREHDAALAQIRQARASRTRAGLERARYRYLVGEKAVPHEQYEEKVATAREASAALDGARAQAKSAAQRIDQAVAQLARAQRIADEAGQNAPHQVAMQHASVSARQAEVDAAEAAVARAELDFSYTKIAAPADGIIGRRSAEVGEHVQPGQELLAFVDTRDVWVTANFKETQLRHMEAGQRARVHVDALGRDFDGELVSFAAASGARFSLLPPENATGNYVKVVQRLPMRVHLTPGQRDLDRLRPGMSVEVKVFIK
jgi:membrane fusion protein (multidrug efflux system)